MIDDMALLKQAMERMDAEDPTVAQAAKDRAAQILGEARLSFAKLAELIQQRRLLLQPAIVARIKRMDQPGMLGDAAFRDTGSALRKEGQSFLQIAEAIEASGKPALRYGDPVQPSAPLHQIAGEPLYQAGSEPDEPVWMTALVVVGSIISFPLRHPVRFLVFALLAILLFYSARGVVTLSQQVSGYFSGAAEVRQRADSAMSSLGSFVNERILRRSTEATAPPTPQAPIPSPSATASSPPSPIPAPATAAAPLANAPAPSASEPASAAPPSAASGPPAAAPAPPLAAPAGPPSSTSRRDARSTTPSRSAANCGAAREDGSTGSRRCPTFEADRRSRSFEDIVPEGVRRNSRVAGPCIGGVGGCYWGGGQH